MYLFHLKLHEKLIVFYLVFLCDCLLAFLGIWLACRKILIKDAGNMSQKRQRNFIFKISLMKKVRLNYWYIFSFKLVDHDGWDSVCFLWLLPQAQILPGVLCPAREASLFLSYFYMQRGFFFLNKGFLFILWSNSLKRRQSTPQ